MPSAQAQASAFTTVAFVVAGAMICYRRDRAEHMSFASSHKLAIRNTQIEQERARLEVRVQERLAEREHLSHELHHRVYNNLQIVTSMLRLERSERSNQDIEESFRSLENRLQSMTIAQRKLYDGTELIALELSDLLREVIAHRSGPETSGAPVAIEESAGRARIAPENTVPAALALNELLSMAEAHANGQGYSVSIEALPTRNRARVTAAPRPSADGEIEGCADMLSEHILVALAEQLDGSVDCGEPDARAALRPHFSFELPAQCSDRE
jgi:two-component sensor histidine kinase